MSTRNELDLFVIEVLLGSDPNSILPFIRGKKRLFPTCSLYCNHEIFTEAYHRAVKKIDRGDRIPCLPGWFKKTTYNIILEYSRGQISQKKIVEKSKIVDSLFGENENLNFSTVPNLSKLEKVLKTLKPQDFLILRLRIVEGWSWSEIGDYLVQCGEVEENTSRLQNTLCKKGARILKRLQKEFFSA